jgi:signal transduction histidine kinase
MDSFFAMTFNLLITPPGNYLYYVVLALLVATTLQSTYLTRRGPLDEARARLMIGMFFVLLVQILYLSSTFLGWLGYADPRQFLPPADRAATLLMVIIIFWAWAFPERSRAGDLAFIFAGVVTVLFLTGNLMNQLSLPPEWPYNATLWDWIWQILIIITALVAIMVLSNRKPDGWQTGMAFFGVILLGFIANLALITNEGSFSGITRLALLIAFLLLPTLAQRFKASEFEPAPPLSESLPAKNVSKRDFKELEGWLELNALTDTETFFPALARLVSQSMHADRAFIVVPSDSRGQITFQSGYNYETGESYPMSTASDATLPALTRAAFFSRPQLLDHKEHHEELNHLAISARILGIGSALFIPFSPQQKKWGGVLIVKTATRKAWMAEDEERLTTLMRSASLVLDKILELNIHAQSLKIIASDLESAQLENSTLKDDLKKINEQSGYERAEPELNALLAVQQESQDLIASLQRDNRQLLKEMEELRASLDTSDPEHNPVRLAAELAAARERISALEIAMRHADETAAQVDLIEAVLSELRKPVAALNGQIESLLSDPASQEQDQRLKTLKSALEDIHTRLGDLDQMNLLENGMGALEVEETDLSQVLDQTMASTRSQMSQKALNLRIDLPEELPPFFSYKGAMKQVLVHVIENAIDASAIGAEIELKVQTFTEEPDESPYLLFQVTDWGGGRDMQDIRRLFSRPPAERSGEPMNGNGGLFVANRLVEAHGGRLWVDSEKGAASVFSILLPLRPQGLKLNRSES